MTATTREAVPLTREHLDALAGQARRLAADYRGSPLRAHREVSDVLSKLAAENGRLLARAEAASADAERAEDESLKAGQRAMRAEAERDAARAAARNGGNLRRFMEIAIEEDGDEPMTAVEWLADFDQAARLADATRAALAPAEAPRHD